MKAAGLSLLFALVAILALPIAGSSAQNGPPAQVAGGETARAALERARLQSRRARERGLAFEEQERRSTEASERASARAAALAARVQQEEAAIAAAEAELRLIDMRRRALDRRLAERRGPIAELVAALQTLIRRPLSLALLRPGSLRETAHLVAVLDSTVPLVRAQTADLRGAIDRVAALDRAGRATLAEQRESERRLSRRRADLVALSERERLIARRASGAANREEVRALALGEEARDLDALMGRMEDAARLRHELAALPGPVLRPEDPARARVAADPRPSPAPASRPLRYRLPVTGRIVAGFGEAQPGGGRSSGLELATRPRAQVVAPAAGRVSFAGPYRGYGRIVIVEHDGGLTSLVTGLAELDVRVGDKLISGSPLGRASAEAPRVALELRHNGRPVNPLDQLSRRSSNGA